MICRESYLFIRGRYFMDKNFLTGKLSEYVRIKDELVETEEISEKVSMLKIRDTLLLIGNIIKEDLDEEFYIGTINAGIANKNIAFIIIKKNEGNLAVCCYAREGLIKQHTARKAIEKFERELLR
jgi:hypothetical protein